MMQYLTATTYPQPQEIVTIVAEPWADETTQLVEIQTPYVANSTYMAFVSKAELARVLFP